MMIRPFTLFCVFFAGVSGMVLYAQKHKTTLLDKQITKIVYDTQKIKSRTAMLRTEWTLLNQPDRLKELSAKFIPVLHPYSPSQFVQISAATSMLPPITKTPEKDKTREDLVKNVAQNHGQSGDIIADATTAQKDLHQTSSVQAPPIIIPANNNADASPPMLQQKPQQTVKPVVTATNPPAEPVVAPAPVKRKKVKIVEVAEASDAIKTQTLKPQTIKKPSVVANAKPKENSLTDQSITPASALSTHRKKVKPIETADTNDSVDTPNLKPQTIKKNHIENVAYNIQSGNPFSHNKTLKPKQTQSSSNSIQKKRSSTVTVAHSESALGGSGDEALPAPVPFAP
ncbi:Predicted secreted (periplasmic) protein [Commensalibacter communis]|uniref:cell division protein FtsL n=1 Tax=Commensalibacter communis TaxID=2972786 RepID=UPI0022FF92BA|nr:hypothetical protein [Commensalibacter communis]CAI3931302.1 Predicted secreted (periplasmic) protein [Commensalibacter communis]